MNSEYSNQLFKEIFKELSFPVLVLNENFRITTVNNKFELGNAYEGQLGTYFLKMVDKNNKKRVKNELTLILNNKKSKAIISNVILKDNNNQSTQVDLEIKLLNKTGELLVTIYEEATNEIDEIYQNYKTVFKISNDALFLIEVTDDGKFVYNLLNRTYERLIALKTEEVKGKTPKEVFGEKMGQRIVNNFQKCLAEKDTLSYQEEMILSSGKRKWLTKLSPVIINNQVAKIIGSSKDITTVQNQKEKIEYISLHDQLTDLYNRRFYDEKIKEINQHGKFPTTIIIGDSNGLKITNDVFGHKAGDELLKLTAEIIENSTRQKDLVIRWGGDEFCIIAPETTYQEGKKIIKRINKNISNYDFDKIPISIAFGLATTTKANHNLSSIFNEAEDDMYRNKEKQKGNFKNKLLKSLSKEMQESNYDIVNHSQRMIELGEKIADKLNYSAKNKSLLIKAIKFHDIGKLVLDNNLLEKKKSYSAPELEQLKKHPEYSYKIINNFKSFSRIASGILHHHEHWDGSGYPDGLKRENIPKLSRIIAVIDAFDALIFRGINHELSLTDDVNHLSEEKALAKIQEHKGSYFDPEVVNIFSKLF